MALTPDLFTAGGAMLDCIVAHDGALALDVIGGNAVHAAVGAALMGVRAGVVARVPEGWPGECLANAGLDISGLRFEDAPMPEPEWFLHRADGSRVDRLHASLAEAEAFGVCGAGIPITLARAWEAHLRSRPDAGHGWAAFRAAHPVLPEHVPAEWWGARGIHVAPGATGSQLALARAARAHGLLVTLDPGFAAAGLAPDLLDALMAICDVFLPSEKELHALRPGLTAAAALASLARPGGPMLLAKLGGTGALLLDPASGVPELLPALPVNAADPTGAGDAFAGGVLAGLVLGEPIAVAARRGIVAGAFAVERPGALAPLSADRADVAQRLNQVLESRT